MISLFVISGSIMLSQRKATTIRKLEGKRPKESMSSSSLSGMSQLSNSSEETLEPFVHKPHNSNTEKRWVLENYLNGYVVLNLYAIRFYPYMIAHSKSFLNIFLVYLYSQDNYYWNFFDWVNVVRGMHKYI